MTKKERRVLRALDKKLGMQEGTHEFWCETYPHIKDAIISTAKKESKK